ncbi:MAG: MbnP family protein [Flavobacteriales bacterium]
MKHYLLFISMFLVLASYAQNSVILEFNHKMGAEDLELNTEYVIPNGHHVVLSKCKYYVSQIKITHDGGITTSVDDKWLLVDGFTQTNWDLGDFDISEVESLTFSVGVETPTNNNDPSLWPSHHPLAPQNPSMHWGWAGGYRFVAMEGYAGINSAEFVLDLHALGNENYHEQTIDMTATAVEGQINLAVKADYSEAFTGVSATAAGGLMHGVDGDCEVMLNNFRDAVFSAGTVLSVSEALEDDVSVSIAPNPTPSGQDSRLLLDLNNSKDYTVEITDITGKMVFSELVSSQTNVLNLPIVQSGIYLINLKVSDSVVLTEKWVVNK